MGEIKLTLAQALRMFSQELGDGKIYTVYSPLTNVPMYCENLVVFRRKLRTLFGIKLSEDKIPVSCFTTVGDLLDWCIQRTYLTEAEVHDGESREESSWVSASLSKPMLNIIITGRSGAGKSSFLNYLIDKEFFKTGEGAPVTSGYFEDFIYTSPENGVTYHLFDTKGIEPTTTIECQQQVIGEIYKKDKSYDIYQWIHTVYYCFDASAKRIQPFEVSFIKVLMKEASVVILLTKKDLVTDEGIAELKKQIEKEIGTNVQVVSVCSVVKRTRKGISSRSGREDVLKASFLGLWEKLSKIYPQNEMRFLTKEDAVSSLDLKGVERFRKENEYAKELLANYTEKLKKGAEKSFCLLSLDYLCDYPTLRELFLDGLNREDRTDIECLMTITNVFLRNLSNTLCRIDVERLWATNEKKHEQVFDFYMKLNRERPHVFYSHQSKDALVKLHEYGKNQSFAEATSCSCNVNKALQDIADCWFSDRSEKEYARGAYDIYRDKVREISCEVKRLIDNFIVAYQSELHQYGQCCLRNDDLKNMSRQSDLIFTETDLNSNERSYYATLCDFLKDHKITTTERILLDNMRKNLGISPMRAGLIEDFIRNEYLRK
jgi:hypothetical protein